MKKNIFVFGLDDYNLKELQSIEHAADYNFIGLFPMKEIVLLVEGEQIDFAEKLARAREKLDSFDKSIDAIIAFFDPAMLMTFTLCQEYGLRSPSLLSALLCEHKYWSRVEQQKVVPGNIPRFTAIDPNKDYRIEEMGLELPFWLKPVNSYGSQLGFKIQDQEELDKALKQTRQHIGYFAKPFNHILSLADLSALPGEMKRIDGNYCVAEEIISGKQITVEGYVFEGEVCQHGFFDSETYENHSSFFAYLTPSELPGNIQKRIMEITEKVIGQVGYDNSAFNLEYYYDSQNDQIWLLEVNTRISQSHSEIFKKVHGRSNHQFLVKTALGRKPEMERKQGKYPIAGKLHYRVFTKKGRVTRLPSTDRVKELEKEFDALIFILAQEGQKLSEMAGQDAYSCNLVNIHMGAGSKKELYQKYEHLIELLDIGIDS